MNFKVFFVNFRFTDIFVKIFTDIYDISVITDILFLGYKEDADED